MSIAIEGVCFCASMIIALTPEIPTAIKGVLLVVIALFAWFMKGDSYKEKAANTLAHIVAVFAGGLGVAYVFAGALIALVS